jgi:hypothetical protein
MQTSALATPGTPSTSPAKEHPKALRLAHAVLDALELLSEAGAVLECIHRLDMADHYGEELREIAGAAGAARRLIEQAHLLLGDTRLPITTAAQTTAAEKNVAQVIAHLIDAAAVLECIHRLDRACDYCADKIAVFSEELREIATVARAARRLLVQGRSLLIEQDGRGVAQ